MAREKSSEIAAEAAKLEKSERAMGEIKKEYGIGKADFHNDFEIRKAEHTGVEVSERKLDERLTGVSETTDALEALRERYPDFEKDMRGVDDEATFALLIRMHDAGFELAHDDSFPVDVSEDWVLGIDKLARSGRKFGKEMMDYRLKKLELIKSVLAGEMGLPEPSEKGVIDTMRKEDRMSAVFATTDLSPEHRGQLLEQVTKDLESTEQTLAKLEGIWDRQVLPEDEKARTEIVNRYTDRSKNLKAKLAELRELMADLTENYTKGKMGKIF